MDIRFHPYADVWPLVEGLRFDKLVADIKAHGLHYPITLYQDMILDGRNRYRACLKAGVEPRFEVSKVKDDRDALILSASLNEHRRHMSVTELAFVAAELSKFSTKAWNKQEKDKYSDSEVSNDTSQIVITIDDAADAVGVGRQSVADAKTLNKPEHADLKADVKAGKTSLRVGATKARERTKAKIAPKPKRSPPTFIGRPILKSPRTLYRNDVDPEFVGDHLAFIAEYGQVWTMTSQERSTSRFSDWAIGIGHLAKELERQQLPRISDATLSWLRNPNEFDQRRMEAAVPKLEAALATARTLLERAKTAKERAA